MFNTCGRVVFEISDGGSQQSEVDSGETSQSLFVFFGTYRTLKIVVFVFGLRICQAEVWPEPECPQLQAAVNEKA